MMKKSRIIICLLLALCMIAVTGCTAAENAATQAPADVTASAEAPTATETTTPQDPMYLGVIVNVTGNGKATYDQTKVGVDLALEEINEAGGILGRKLDVVYFDGMSDQQGFVNAHKLALEDKRLDAILYQTTSMYFLACLPDLENIGKPIFTSPTSMKIRDAANPYVYMITPTDNYIATAQVNYLTDTLGCKNPAIWTSTQENAFAGMQVMVEQLKQRGIEVPESMIFSSELTEQNFAPVAASIKATGCDGLLVMSASTPLPLLAKACVDAGVDIPIVAWCFGPSTIETSAGAMNGWYGIATFTPTDSDPLIQNYVQKLKDMNGDDVVIGGDSCNGYNVCYYLKAACEAANTTTDREKINEGFKTIKDLRRVGPGYISYTDDHVLPDSLYVAKAIDGIMQYQATVKFK